MRALGLTLDDLLWFQLMVFFVVSYMYILDIFWLILNRDLLYNVDPSERSLRLQWQQSLKLGKGLADLVHLIHYITGPKYVDWLCML